MASIGDCCCGCPEAASLPLYSIPNYTRGNWAKYGGIEDCCYTISYTFNGDPAWTAVSVVPYDTTRTVDYSEEFYGYKIHDGYGLNVGTEWCGCDIGTVTRQTPVIGGVTPIQCYQSYPDPPWNDRVHSYGVVATNSSTGTYRQQQRATIFFRQRFIQLIIRKVTVGGIDKWVLTYSAEVEWRGGTPVNLPLIELATRETLNWSGSILDTCYELSGGSVLSGSSSSGSLLGSTPPYPSTGVSFHNFMAITKSKIVDTLGDLRADFDFSSDGDDLSGVSGGCTPYNTTNNFPCLDFLLQPPSLNCSGCLSITPYTYVIPFNAIVCAPGYEQNTALVFGGWQCPSDCVSAYPGTNIVVLLDNADNTPPYTSVPCLSNITHNQTSGSGELCAATRSLNVRRKASCSPATDPNCDGVDYWEWFVFVIYPTLKNVLAFDCTTTGTTITTAQEFEFCCPITPPTYLTLV